MTLPKYDIIDSYTLEELKRKYQNSGAKGRIRLLKKLGMSTPYEIALMAVEDPDVEVRQWIARNGEWLDYRKENYIGDDLVYKFPERNLEDRLKADPDPFVRACLRENPNVFRAIPFSYKWKEYFSEVTPLERLALVRNPNVADELIQHIFNHEDTELGIDIHQRAELVLAFLTNKEQIKRSYPSPYDLDLLDPWDTTFLDYYTHFRKLWELISKWPRVTSNPQWAVYRYLGATDKTKSKIYQTCDVPVWREQILRNCTRKDTHTIQVGMEDSHEGCRELAYSQLHEASPGFDSALKGSDKIALRGLAKNNNLSLIPLKMVRDRLKDLKDEMGEREAQETIDMIGTSRPAEAESETLDDLRKSISELQAAQSKQRRLLYLILGLLLILLVILL